MTRKEELFAKYGQLVLQFEAIQIQFSNDIKRVKEELLQFLIEEQKPEETKAPINWEIPATEIS